MSIKHAFKLIGIVVLAYAGVAAGAVVNQNQGVGIPGVNNGLGMGQFGNNAQNALANQAANQFRAQQLQVAQEKLAQAGKLQEQVKVKKAQRAEMGKRLPKMAEEEVFNASKKMDDAQSRNEVKAMGFALIEGLKDPETKKSILEDPTPANLKKGLEAVAQMKDELIGSQKLVFSALETNKQVNQERARSGQPVPPENTSSAGEVMKTYFTRQGLDKLKDEPKNQPQIRMQLIAGRFANLVPNGPAPQASAGEGATTGVHAAPGMDVPQMAGAAADPAEGKTPEEAAGEEAGNI